MRNEAQKVSHDSARDTLVLRVLTYTRTPGGRYPTDGKFPGSEFLEKHLLPAFEEAKSRGLHLLVDLDGTAGYASSFLEEAFGGLARKHGAEAVKAILKVKSVDEPYLADDIWLYVAEA